MLQRRTHTLSGDRAGDRPTIVAGEVKPPILSRRAIRRLCLLCLTVIVWGTLGPVANEDYPWVASPKTWTWLPPIQHSDLNDLLTNFAIYLPVGVAFRLLVRRRGRAGKSDLLIGLGLSVVLSYATELLQQVMPARSSNLTDVAVNGLAAFAGCLAAPSVQRFLRRGHAALFAHARDPRHHWSLLASAAALGAAVLMTAPWRLTAPSAELGLSRPLSPPDLQRFTIFVVVGFLATGAGLLRGGRIRHAILAAAIRAMALAAVLEAVQAVLGGHICSLMHVLVSIAGVIAGCLAAPMFVRQTNAGIPLGTPRPLGGPVQAAEHQPAGGSVGLRRLAAAVLALTLVYAVAIGLWQSGPLGNSTSGPRIQWVPFRTQFMSPFATMLADLVQQLAAYTVLTVACLLLTGGRGRGVSLMLLTGLVGALEAGKAFWHPRGADTTAPLLALACWLATVRVWRSIYPRRRRAATQTT